MTVEPPAGQEPGPIVREVAQGIARIPKPPVVRAFATVPGSLSVPRKPPRTWPRLASRATVFPRRGQAPITAETPGPVPAPPLTATPADSETLGHAGGDGAPGVRPDDGPAAPAVRHDDSAVVPAVRHDDSAAAPGVRAAVGDSAAGVRAEVGGAPAGVRAEVGDRAPGVPNKSLLRRLALPALTAAVAAFAAGTGFLAVTDHPIGPGEVGRWGALSTGASPRPAGPVSASAGRDPFGRSTARPVGSPTRLRVPAIGVDTSLEQLRLDSAGALRPPRAFGKAGWYAQGTAPGDVGPAVLAGHVDSRSGPAVFFKLRELSSGDRIEVVRGGSVLSFTVTRTAWYPKSTFPTKEVYGPTPDRQLRLITCGGVFDRSLRSYRDNLVVYAVAG